MVAAPACSGDVGSSGGTWGVSGGSGGDGGSSGGSCGVRSMGNSTGGDGIEDEGEGCCFMSCFHHPGTTFHLTVMTTRHPLGK